MPQKNIEYGMNKTYKTNNAEQNDILKKLYFIILAILICAVLPIWYLGRYDVTCLDDFYFGTMTYQAWKESHSFGAVVQAAVEQVKFYYNAKQATYASVFLMSAYPGVWNEKLYFFTPFIMSSMIIGSVTALVHVVISDCMGVKDRFITGIINCLLIFLILQTLPVPLEGLFWYNGSLHYVFMESVFIIEAAVILHGMHSTDKKTGIWTLIVASLLGFVVGGGNLVTGLQACILMGLHILVMIASKVSDSKEHKSSVVSGNLVQDIDSEHQEKDRSDKTDVINKSWLVRLGFRKYDRAQLVFLIPEAITFICYMINITAPGNAERQEGVVQMNPIKAIIMSFYYGISHVVTWITPMMIVIMVVAAVLLARLASKSTHHFIHPVLMGIIGLCVFAAMFTPVLYAMSEDAPSRIQNIIYIAEVLIIFLNLVNDIGYIYTTRECRETIIPDEKKIQPALTEGSGILSEEMNKVITQGYDNNGEKTGIGCFFRLIFGITDNAIPAITLTGIAVVMILFIFAADKNTYTSISAARSILNGEASRYYAQSMERFEIYHDDDIKDVVINAYTEDARPYLLFKEDVGNIPGEEGYWMNVEICNHYQKDSITVVGR